MGLRGLEPPTSRLSGVRSNGLSYKPALIFFLIRQPPILPYRCQYSTFGRFGLNRRVRDGNGCYPKAHRHRKSFGIRPSVARFVLFIDIRFAHIYFMDLRSLIDPFIRTVPDASIITVRMHVSALVLNTQTVTQSLLHSFSLERR